jgi:hypothetical protein
MHLSDRTFGLRPSALNPDEIQLDRSMPIDDLVGIVGEAAGLDSVRAETVASIVLNLIQTQGNPAKVVELFGKLPGAQAMATRANSGGGLMGKMAGGMMGGPLAAITRLQAVGLSTDQQKIVMSTVLSYCGKHGGADLVKAAAANVPGVSGYL